MRLCKRSIVPDEAPYLIGWRNEPSLWKLECISQGRIKIGRNERVRDLRAFWPRRCGRKGET
jgi:hypothetical protein